MYYHIVLTERCNLKCKYCYEKSMKEFENGLEKKWTYDDKAPFDSAVKGENLKNFLVDGDTLIFYGGEPLIMIDKIEEIIKSLDGKNIRYYIQTNGILLNKLPDEILKKISKILVSIDGDKEIDGFNKGKIHYDMAVRNIKILRERGFRGEIVARMVMAPPYCFDVKKQVLHLVKLIKEGLFDSIHWQIDAGFYKNDFDFDSFSDYVKKYNTSVQELVTWWLSELQEGRVWKIYPFFGILARIKKWDTETRLPCGAGYANFTINTYGKISACPIMNSVENFYCGSVEEGPNKLREIKIVDEKCRSCSYFDICGGRCLYWRSAKLWPPEGDELICKTIKNIIDSIREITPKIDLLLKNQTLKEEDFSFEKYFGPEIIP
ncbi:hypothetical protein B6U91_01630 [Candidatus Pacearchaeota archaeon ex4484_71]|nr:MAG: hypothetical protein B6U91_01630 [Candidatus Pacearchaeota archaeon ex4484_71]